MSGAEKRSRLAADAELAELARQIVTLPRPIDINEAGRIRRRMEEIAREVTTGPLVSSDAARIFDQALDIVIDVYALLQRAYGVDLAGRPRSEPVSAFFLAQIRDRLRGFVPERPHEPCAACLDLRQRIVNVYHLTLTGDDPAATVRAVRDATAPGAPAPPSRGAHAF